MTTLTQQEFDLWAKYIYHLTGIALSQEKAYLIESRLHGLLQEYACPSFSHLYSRVCQETSRSLQNAIIDRITTQETFFFRNEAPFDVFKYKILPDLIDSREKTPSKTEPIPIRIWSAGCSTGQEVYSIAISLHEMLGSSQEYKLRILGTDISDAVLARASAGVYTSFEIERGFNESRLAAYVHQEKNKWRICDQIRSMVSFKRHNLFHPFSHLGVFDIIFCRNVAIYFSRQDKKQFFSRLAKVLAADGYLILGSSESLTGIAPQFTPRRYLRAVYYQLQTDKNLL